MKNEITYRNPKEALTNHPLTQFTHSDTQCNVKRKATAMERMLSQRWRVHMRGQSEDGKKEWKE